MKIHGIKKKKTVNNFIIQYLTCFISATHMDICLDQQQ